MSRDRVLTDAQWVLLERLLPSSKGKQSRPFRDHRQVIEDIVFRLRTGCPWRDLPERFGSWQTVWKRHARFSKDGIWDQVMAALLTRADQADQADQAGYVDWQLSIDSTISRVHQHGLNMTRALAAVLPSHTGDPSNDKRQLVEPINHAIGRSRGGLKSCVTDALLRESPSPPNVPLRLSKMAKVISPWASGSRRAPAITVRDDRCEAQEQVGLLATVTYRVSYWRNWCSMAGGISARLWR